MSGLMLALPDRGDSMSRGAVPLIHLLRLLRLIRYTYPVKVLRMSRRFRFRLTMHIGESE